MNPHPSSENRRAWRHTLLVLGGILVFALLLYFGIAYLLVLIFGGLLVGTVFRMLTRGVERITRLPHGLAMLLVLALLAGVLVLAGWAAAPRLVEQAHQLAVRLPVAFERFRQQLGHTSWGRYLLFRVPRWAAGEGGVSPLTRLTGALAITLDVVVGVIVVFFVGLYSAYEPHLYAKGLLEMFPAGRQRRMGQVLAAVDYALRWWILGQLITMTVLGLFTGLGLWLVGVPLALVLGVISGLLNFIPTFGALMAFVPAALLAVAESPRKLLYVLFIWLGAHLLEGYILTPMIQRRTVWLPPVLGISAQVILGVLLGPVGLIFAHPLVVAGMVVVKMLYVEDALGNKTDIPGQ